MIIGIFNIKAFKFVGPGYFPSHIFYFNEGTFLKEKKWVNLINLSGTNKLNIQITKHNVVLLDFQNHLKIHISVIIINLKYSIVAKI